MSALWEELGSALAVGLNFRNQLHGDITHSADSKLEKVLAEWIHNETKDVKWQIILKALEDLHRRDVIKKVISCLEEPKTYHKYYQMKDFAPCPDFIF